MRPFQGCTTEELSKQELFNFQKYQYILRENSTLKKEKHDSDNQIMALKHDNDQNLKNLINKNEILKQELNCLKIQQLGTYSGNKLIK
jgi:hypothetical protein